MKKTFFNAEETGLFFKCMLNKILIFKHEKVFWWKTAEKELLSW